MRTKPAPKILPSMPQNPFTKPAPVIIPPAQQHELICPIPKTRFDVAVRYCLKNEDGKDYCVDRGSFTNNPKDPGGATMWGVIKTEYEKHLGRSLTIADIQSMPRETALAIYRKEFWDVIHGDDLDSEAAAIAIMDTAVNKGIGGCMTVLHDALDNTNFHYYREVVPMVNAWEPHRFIAAFEPALIRYIDHRIAKYPNMEWARAGWTNRAKRILALAGA